MEELKKLLVQNALLFIASAVITIGLLAWGMPFWVLGVLWVVGLSGYEYYSKQQAKAKLEALLKEINEETISAEEALKRRVEIDA
jgi:hypothetical protein